MTVPLPAQIAAVAVLATLKWVQRHRDRLLAMAPELREGAET